MTFTWYLFNSIKNYCVIKSFKKLHSTQQGIQVLLIKFAHQNASLKKIENLPKLYFFALVRWKITLQSFFNFHLSKCFLLTQAKFWRSMLGFAVLILWSLSYVILQTCKVAAMASFQMGIFWRNWIYIILIPAFIYL